MAKLRGNGGKGDEGLYEGPMVYKLLTWHRPKKGHPTSTSPVEIYYKVEVDALLKCGRIKFVCNAVKVICRIKFCRGSVNGNSAGVCKGETVVKIRDGKRVYDRVQMRPSA
ncbi:hypothetical protein ALC60_03103 [Trachymyrmex zeteki]|uniref:Uncharacterized protein n=1 Tax=Mycetomoellerius zeteki TaxID=64791 RepID=A0A151XCE4_9HYME|nr:hypothetical protein ALC60_03103 [Trachymyrmex zeteki]